MNMQQATGIEEKLPALFLSKITFEPNSGCWLWSAAINNSGYGTFWSGKRCHAAHRFCFEALNGPRPGCDLDHLCRVRCCVNPSHLEPVSRSENCLRGVGYGKFNRTKTHCPKGHPLSGSNVQIVKETATNHRRRRCIICRNANQRAYNARKAVSRD